MTDEDVELDVDRDDVTVVRDRDDERRIEYWTNGEWIRIGKTVYGDPLECIEASFEDYSELVQRIDEAHAVEPFTMQIDRAALGHSSRYLVDITDSFGEINVFDGTTHVLRDTDHEHRALYRALGDAQKMRREFEPMEVVQSAVENITSDFDDVWIEDTDRSRVSVEIVQDPSDMKFEFVNFSLVDDIEELVGHPEASRECTVKFDRELDAMVYSFTVDARNHRE